MKKTQLKIIGLVAVILLAAILVGKTTQLSLVQQPSPATTTKKAASVKKSAPAKKRQPDQKHFYKKIYPIPGVLEFINYPADFAGLVATGDLAIVGQVTALKSYVYQGSTVAAYTLATIKVQRILANSGKKSPKSIKVLFAGGNIRKDLLLGHLLTKDFISADEKAAMNSSALVTAKYSYCPLPQINQKLAVIVSHEPAGTNGVEQSFYMPVFSGKGVFLKQKDGRYARERIDKSMPLNHDDGLMNQGMTELIKGTQQI
ncbi:hypothetical protein [Lapidilactobacillus wuchangensis]|uniref:hypothetical protein n=1 Tax=Lapidilactobacillus wuchangensis TaxID=2486001 RepID=UPI000F7885F3|nr:hypothetical protein [Lapidilactobacillus wuchangensis]